MSNTVSFCTARVQVLETKVCELHQELKERDEARKSLNSAVKVR
jgi:hypothetical protein